MNLKGNMSLEKLARNAERAFAQKFGQSPKWLVSAPGRVNLIGEHTDYNDGFVLPMAIERHTVIAAGPANAKTRGKARRIWISSLQKGGFATIDLSAPIRRGLPKWANYIKGVVAGFQALDCTLEPMEWLVASDVPLGGGLSSSASLEVATATLLETVTGRKLDPVEKALLCQKAEHDFALVPCGIMDQFTSVMAQANHLLLLDCRSRKTELIPMTDPAVSVLIVNSNVHHKLMDGEYAKRRKDCETAARRLGVKSLRDATPADLAKARNKLEQVIYRRARHVISENARTLQTAREIRNGNWEKAGQLMYESHDSLRYDYEVSCPELDCLVEIAKNIGPENGVWGCRMTGGGFGGCTVSLVQKRCLADISRRFKLQYRKATGIEPSLFVSRPAAGASIIQS